MSVCDVLRFSDGRRTGYIAILNSQTNGKRNAVKIYGDFYGNNFKMFDMSLLEQLNVKTLRAKNKFDKYIKSCFPNAVINPVAINGVVFDLPYISINNILCAEWEPVFEECVDKSSFNILSEGLIVEYYFQQPIFVSVLNAKRHVPKSNLERLLINRNTGLITRSVARATATSYFEGTYHIENGCWKCDSYNEVPIAGYKLR